MLAHFKCRGFSLSEAMVSLTIVAGMAIGLSYLIGRGSESRRLEEKKIQLVQTSKYLESRIRKDLATAVRPTGNTRKSFNGINLLEDLAPNKYPNGGLALVVERFGQFSTPTEISLIGNDPTRPALMVKVENSDLASQYIQTALTKNKLFLISNIQYSNVVQITGTPTTIGSNPTRIQVPVENLNFNRTEHFNTTSNIRTLEVVVYFLQDGKVYRDVYTSLPNNNSGEPIERAVLAEDVTQLDFDFAFEDRRQSNLVIPQIRLKHPKNYRDAEGCDVHTDRVCCSNANLAADRCVTMNDVRDIRLRSTLTVKDAKFRAQEGVGDGFKSLNGLLQYTAEAVFIPLRYDLKTGDIGLIGQSINCPLNDYASRCKSECLGDNGPFKNHSLLPSGAYPPDWWEYGNLDSNYCKCGTVGGKFIAPEANNGRIPAWSASAGSNQNIEYCAKHFPSCSISGGVTWIMSKYPASHLACWCLMPRPGSINYPATSYYSRNTNTAQSNYGEYTVNVPRSLNEAGHILNDLNANPQNENNMWCTMFRGCDELARVWFTDMTRTSPWRDRCSCTLNNVNENGVLIPGDSVHRMYVDWNQICNADFMQGLSATPACGSTVDAGSRSYRLKSASNPQGLNEGDAAFCACYNQQGYNTTNIPYAEWGNPHYLDFRRGTPMQDPILPAGALPTLNNGQPATNFGAKQSLAVSINAVSIEGSTTQNVPVGGNCDRIYCDIRFNGGMDMGCCTANRPVNWTVPVLQQRPQLAQILNRSTGLYPGNYLDYVSYCSPECTGSSPVNIPGRGNVDEVQRIREIITGTAPGQPIPPICGQQAYGSAGGN